jgi:hypothetical protein
MMPGDPAAGDLVREVLAARADAAARFGFTAPEPAPPEPAPPPEPQGPLVPPGPMGAPPAGGDLVRAALRSAHRYR